MSFQSDCSPEGSAAAAGNPVIIRISDGIKPGQLLSLYGEDMKGTVKVIFIEPGIIVDPVQQDDQGQFLRVIVPDIPPGAYTVQLSNDNGASWSNAMVMNMANPCWLSEDRGYPGMPIKLVGKNLDASEYNGTKNMQIRLVPTGEGMNISVTPSHVTPHAVDFAIPVGTAPGSYYIEMNTNSAALGQQWVRHAETLSVVTAPADDLALSLGVSWTDAFNWDSVYDVKTEFGAAGNGSTDDTASIQSAIDYVSTHGGGTVYFPGGTYLYTHLSMNGNVILKGENRDTAILKYSGNGSDTLIDTKGTGLTIGNIGLADLSFTIDVSNIDMKQHRSSSEPVSCAFFKLGKTWPSTTQRDYANITSENIFVYNVFVDTPLDTSIDGTIMIGSRNNTLIANSHFKGTPFYCPYFVNHGVFRNNTVEMSHNAIEIIGNKLIVVNNTAIGYRNLPSTFELHAFFINPHYGYYIDGAYYANNTVIGMGDPGYRNCGEALIIDGSASFMVGHVTESDASNTTFRQEMLATDERAWSEQWMALVVKGRGMGQLKKIRSYTDNGDGSYTVRLSCPWEVVPDSTSMITVTRCVTNTIYERNTITDCSSGIQVWMGAYDVTISDNTFVDTNSNWHCARIIGQPNPYSNGAEVSYFITTKRSNAAGAGANFLQNNWIGISGEQQQMGALAYISIAYGNEFRENVIDRTGCEDNSDAYATAPAAMPFVFNTSQPASGRGIVATLIEDNVITNSRHGIWIGNAVEGTVIRSNTFNGISGERTHDGGSNTVELKEE